MTDLVTPLTVDAARDRVFAAIAGPVAAEHGWLLDALWRVAAEDVVSEVALPPWDNSAMDGYAIRAADVAAATEDAPVRLEVIGEVRAGQAPETTVRRGTAVRIATGAPMPPGADAVVPVELTTPVDAAGAAGSRGRDATGPLPAACLVHVVVPAGGSVRQSGERPLGRRPRRPGRFHPDARRDRPGRGDRSRRDPGPPPGPGRHPGDRGRGPTAGPGAGSGRHPGCQRTGPGRARRGGRWRGPCPGDRGGPVRRRPRSAVCRARRGTRRDHRVGWRLGRAVRRRPRRLRGVRHHRALARRRPAGQAIRVRYGASARRRRLRPGPPGHPPFRPAREPGLDLRHLRAVRAAGVAAPGGPPR